MKSKISTARTDALKGAIYRPELIFAAIDAMVSNEGAYDRFRLHRMPGSLARHPPLSP
jgi:hypothetical protein